MKQELIYLYTGGAGIYGTSAENVRGGFTAVCYDPQWGGYSYIRLIGYSRARAVRELRRRGVKCPARAWKESVEK